MNTTQSHLVLNEIQCGPAFKTCSGLNRRNAGFETDIPRPDREMWKGD